jgi:purine-binding chemotaxis protein CheW
MSSPENIGESGRAKAGRYLTFRLDDEVYGVPILDVREIIELQDITPVPRSASFVRGVINLRGKVLPLVDLKLRFGMEGLNPGELTVIVVLQTEGSRPFGCLVDEVLEVQWLGAESLSASPLQGPVEEFLSGIGKVKDRLVFLLDLATPLGVETLKEVA